MIIKNIPPKLAGRGLLINREAKLLYKNGRLYCLKCGGTTIVIDEELFKQIEFVQ